jgi:hypothetical protein
MRVAVDDRETIAGTSHPQDYYVYNQAVQRPVGALLQLFYSLCLGRFCTYPAEMIFVWQEPHPAIFTLYVADNAVDLIIVSTNLHVFWFLEPPSHIYFSFLKVILNIGSD